MDNVHWGVAPTWSNLALAVPVAMLAYTGVETVSNLAEEVRDPVAQRPERLQARRRRRLRDLLHAARGSRSRRCRWSSSTASTRRCSACRRRRAATRTTRCSASSRTSGSDGRLLDATEIYVGVLAATILFIATNAGVIGASRITYSMASYRQLPERLPPPPPALQDAVALDRRLRAGSRRSIVILPGDTTFLGTLYSFGATLSFTVAHASLVRAARKRQPERRRSRSARGRTCACAASTGRCSRSSAGSRPAISWLVIVVQNPATRWAGLGWLAVGLAFYVVYRRRVVRAPLTRDRARARARAPAEARRVPATRSFRSSTVPASDEAMEVAARLAAERRRASIVACTVLEVPLDLPLDAELREAEERADAAARRGARDRRLVRRRRRHAHRPRASRRPGDRRRGGRAERRDRRRGRAARSGAGRARSSARRSTSSSSTRPCRVMVAAAQAALSVTRALGARARRRSASRSSR